MSGCVHMTILGNGMQSERRFFYFLVFPRKAEKTPESSGIMFLL